MRYVVKKILLILFSCTFLSVSPMVDSPIKKIIDDKLALASGALRHLTDVTDVILLGNDLWNGKGHDLQTARFLKDKIQQIQKLLQKISLMNRQMNDPRADKVYMGLQIIKHVEELMLLLRDGLSRI